MHKSETCLHCQACITQPPRGRKRLFCSDKCKTKYAREKPKREAEEAECAQRLYNSRQYMAYWDKQQLLKNLAPETKEYVMDVKGLYGRDIAFLVADGVRIELEAEK